MRKIEIWLSDEELKSIYTSSYWNNIEEERKKEWWIEDGNYKKCLDYLDSSGLLYEYQQSEKFIKEYSGELIKVVDLAAGIGWTSVLLSKLSKVKEVHAVEISKHRLDSLFEHSVKMLKGDPNKIFRYLGSFYDLRFDDKSVDIIYSRHVLEKNSIHPFLLIKHPAYWKAIRENSINNPGSEFPASIANMQAVFKHAYRILKPGGIIISQIAKRKNSALTDDFISHLKPRPKKIEKKDLGRLSRIITVIK